MLLRFVEGNSRTYWLCLVAVQKDGCALCYVPFELRTPELCLAAVRQYGPALCWVPVHLQDEIKAKLNL